jgi:hypothetical protein
VRTLLVFLGLALAGGPAFGRCPCEGRHAGSCPGNGDHYLQPFIDTSCPFPPNLLKVEWNGIFGTQSAWVPSAAPGLWRTNVFGVTWEAQRVTDGAAAGHWLVNWTVGTSAFQSTGPASPSNCLESASWTDSRGTWSVVPCDWEKPDIELLGSTNYVKTIEFVGLVDPCGAPIRIGEQRFEFGRVTIVGDSGHTIRIQVSSPSTNVEELTVLLAADPPGKCVASGPWGGGRLVAAYSSSVTLENSGSSIPFLVVSNNLYGTVGSVCDWWKRGGCAVIRARPK